MTGEHLSQKLTLAHLEPQNCAKKVPGGGGGGVQERVKKNSYNFVKRPIKSLGKISKTQKNLKMFLFSELKELMFEFVYGQISPL